MIVKGMRLTLGPYCMWRVGDIGAVQTCWAGEGGCEGRWRRVAAMATDYATEVVTIRGLGCWKGAREDIKKKEEGWIRNLKAVNEGSQRGRVVDVGRAARGWA